MPHGVTQQTTPTRNFGESLEEIRDSRVLIRVGAGVAGVCTASLTALGVALRQPPLFVAAAAFGIVTGVIGAMSHEASKGLRVAQVRELGRTRN